MTFFGLDFVISSLIWLCAVLVFVFTFRHQLKKIFYKKSPFDIFLSKLKTYLKENYPEIEFDYSIIEDSKTEANPETRKYLITDNIINQFISLKLTDIHPKPIPKDLQWPEYTFNCEPNRDKLPGDWVQRKNALLARDDKRCTRCSKPLTLDRCDIHMLRALEKGGKYYLENLIPVCKDCKKVLANDPKKLNYLDIKEDLHDIVKKSL